MKEITLTKDQILNDDELGAIYRKTKQIKEITKQASQSYLHAINLICESHNVRFEIINDPISYINDYINNQNILDISDLSNLNKTLDEIIEDINDIKEILSLKGKI